jgi:hypothetical protein
MAITPPKLMDYSAAIQANQSMSNAFKQLGNTSQDYMDYAEKKKQNGIDNTLNDAKFKETQTINQFNMNDVERKYKADTKEKESKLTANANAFKSLYPEQSAKMSLQFGDIPSVENANKMNNVFGHMDISNFDKNREFNYGKSQDEINNKLKREELNIRRKTANKANKPSYQMVQTVGADGKPTWVRYNKNTNEVIPTNMSVYQTPKTMSDEQRIYYTERANDLKNKQLENMMKNFQNSAGYQNLSDKQKIKAEDYVRTNRTIPKINYSDGGWFGAESYSMGEAVEKQKKNKLKDGSNRDHLAN